MSRDNESNSPKEPFFNWQLGLWFAAASPIFMIILKVFGYDIGDRGLPPLWFIPTFFIAISIRAAWRKRKASRP